MRAWVMLLSLVFVSAASADPLPPVNATYNSPDQVPGGVVLTGRFSESWAAGFEGGVSNTLFAESWDGFVLGTQWQVWCASIAAPPTLLYDTRVGGTGDVAYSTMYAGGRFLFDKNGPWSADNLVDFTGNLQSLTVVSTHQYLAGNRIGVRSNITMVGVFDQLYPSWDQACMDYSIQNGSILGSSPALLPATFPPFLNPVVCPAFGGGVNIGAWGDVDHHTLVITGCAVPARESSWGGIKNRYGD